MSSVMNRKVWDKIFARFMEDSLSKIHYNPVCNVLLRNVHIKPGFKILEPGCGTGLDTLIIAKLLHTEAFLLDYSKEALKVAKYIMNLLKVKAHFILADCRHLPFRDEF